MLLLFSADFMDETIPMLSLTHASIHALQDLVRIWGLNGIIGGSSLAASRSLRLW